MTGRPLRRLIKQFMRVFNYNHLKQAIGGYLGIKSPTVFRLLNQHKTSVKYIFSGGTAALIYLLILFILTDVIRLWYVFSSVAAFVVSLLVNFFLQKFWAFRDNDWQRLRRQLFIYGILGAINFILNPILLYTFVEKFHIFYLLSAVVVISSLAIVNYLINKFITFKKDLGHESFNG